MAEISGTKFISLLSSLSKAEVREFKAYLKQQVGEQAAETVGYLEDFHPAYNDEKKLTVEALRRYLSKLKAAEIGVKRVQNLFSELYKALLTYLRRMAQEEDQVAVSYYELKVFYERGLDEQFLHEARKALKQGVFNTDNPWVEVYEIRLREMLLRHPAYDRPHERLEQLRVITEKLNQLYDRHRLRFVTVWMELHRMLHADLSSDEQAAIRVLADRILSEKADPLLAAYALSFRMEVLKEESAFFELNELLTGPRGGALAPPIRHEVLTLLINFASGRVKNKDLTYLRRAHDLYSWGLESGALQAERGLEPMKFCNAVAVACTQREFEWARNFIDEYQIYLPVEEREDIVKLALANVLVERGEVRPALVLMEELRTSHWLHELRLRTLELRALFDSDQGDDFDKIENKIRQLRYFVNANGLQQDNREMTLNYCQMVSDLYTGKKEPKELRQFLTDCKCIIFQKWIEEKLASYKSF